MKSLKDYIRFILNEAWVGDAGYEGHDNPIFKNPSAKEFAQLKENHNDLDAILDLRTGDVWIWYPQEKRHEDVMDLLGIYQEVLTLYLDLKKNKASLTSSTYVNVGDPDGIHEMGEAVLENRHLNRLMPGFHWEEPF